MSPLEYVNEYHQFRVLMPDLMTSSMITRYQSKADPRQRTEFEAVAARLIALYKIGGVSAYSIPREFYVKGHPAISPTEMFFREGLKRAYDCRGTPEEIRDAVRLACAAGRCDASSASQYVTRWFGLDCNTLVDNWMGLSSGTAIFAYVLGYGPGKLAGGTEADDATRGYLPFPAATNLLSVGQGSVLITYSPNRPVIPNNPDPYNMRFWEHIAVVESFALTVREDDNHAQGVVTIVEWGQAGGEEEHVQRSVRCDLVRGKFVRERSAQLFWAIKSGESYRLILNMPAAVASGSRRTYGVPSNHSL